MAERKTRKRIQTIAIHIVCWFIFLSLPALFNDRIEHFSASSIIYDIVGFRPRLVNNIFFVILFYYSYYIAIPSFYFTRKYVLLVLYFTTTLVAFIGISQLLKPPHFFGRHHHDHLIGPSYNLFMYIITCIFSFALCLYNKWRKVHEEKLNTEISFLKAQINPHFLFNSLNSIYSLALTKSDDAPEAVLKLSGIMRYAVSDAVREYVSLEKEINYINDYIDLQKLRLHKNIALTYSVDGKADDKIIAPFLLIPFIENAFKYGVNSEEDSRININIDIKDQVLLFEVSNLKVTIQNKDESTSGLGITNTKQRLELLYPDKHILTIYDTITDFKVMLKLNIK